MKRTVIKKSLQKALSYEAYREMTDRLVAEGKTTGTEQTEELVHYTRLNSSRMRRMDKKAEVSAQDIEAISEKITGKQTWLVIAESWCGDAAQALPVFNRICSNIPGIELKIVLRDENPGLMELFLTGGTRSIPRLIVLDESLEVLYTWGPRSGAATAMVNDYRALHGKPDAAFKESLQRWYVSDRGASIVDDLLQWAGAKAENDRQMVSNGKS
ncbi:thioredoxin family protein [Sinomicrobium soli]|uniref:thioredoxin family protein n=1 Tax=Sinomicrobium sp. N-1-3-6 TaxID=2219864 RepID=UPI000DCD197D|nr:thioredoxin family protein [Sinomicrobium sp. N-1-3-6]RAV30020.1 thioredoxin family protein [Sinomicrobium sp. N-1-3-6]